MSRPWSILLLPVLLAGCGGGGSGSAFIDGTTGAVSLALTASSDYNGSAAALTGYTSLQGSAAGNIVEITATNSTRAFEISLTQSGLKTGSVVDLAGNTGSKAVYVDPIGQYAATSGTVTVQSRTATGVQLLLTNVVMTHSTTNAVGTVTLNGTLSFVGA